MTKISFGAHPYLLGFEQLERLVERTAKSGDGYPPFNIEAVTENAYRITLAVAGFREEELAHHDHAVQHGSRDAPGHRLLSAVIKVGCRAAI